MLERRAVGQDVLATAIYASYEATLFRVLPETAAQARPYALWRKAYPRNWQR